MNLIKRGIRPSDIMTREAFENAITVVNALGGSTNAVLHLLAMAHAMGVKLTLDDFTRIGKRVPVLADLKPSGKFVMAEFVAIGGLTPLMKTLLDAGLLHGDCLTVTGKTIKQNLAGVKPYPAGQRLSVPLIRSDQEGRPPRRVLRQPRARGRRREDHRQRRHALHRKGRACSTPKKTLSRAFSTAQSKRAT